MKKFHIFILVTLIAATLVVGLRPVYADQNIEINSPQVVTVGESEFEAGQVVIPGIPVYWQSDEPWRITLTTLDPDFSAGGDSATIKPLADMLWKPSDTDSWLPLSQYGGEVNWSNQTGSGVVYVDLVVNLDWLKDAPGEYHVNLLFTIEPI